MRTCPQCGSPATDRDQFCRSCGAPFSSPARSPERPGSGLAVPLGLGAVCVALVMLLVAAVQSITADQADGSIAASSWSPPPVVLTPDPPSPSPTPTDSESPMADLLSHIPSDIVATCFPETVDGRLGRDLTAAVLCSPTGPRAPDRVRYWLYSSDDGMNAAFRYVVRGEAPPDLAEDQKCPTDGGRGTWQTGGGPRGSYVCYQTRSTGGRIWWTTDGLAIMAVAAGNTLSNERAWAWFSGTEAGPL